MLPAAAGHGQFRWSIIDAKDTSHLIGRIAIVSRAAGVSSSYSCPVCCPDSYWTGVLGPDNINVPVGGVSGYTVREDLQDCYGNDAGLVDRFASSWSVQFSNVTSTQTTGTGTAQASGLSGGSSTIAGHWNTTYYESSEFTHECFQFSTTADAPGNVETLTPTYVSVIGTPRYTQGPPAPYVFIVNREVLDQHHNPLNGVRNYSEFYDPNPASAVDPFPTCTTSRVETGSGQTDGSGLLPPDFYSLGSAANPCQMRSVQHILVGGTEMIPTYTVTWSYSNVSVQ